MTTGSTALLPTPTLDEDAWEDLPAVQQIKAGLEAAGITTWFDIDRLEVGDDYDRKIQRNMADGALFITQLPGGQVTPEFARRLAEFMRGRVR